VGVVSGPRPTPRPPGQRPAGALGSSRVAIGSAPWSPSGPDWAARRAARDRGQIAGPSARFAAWLADADAPDPRTHPDDPDGEIARASAIAAAIAIRRRAAGRS